MASTEKSLQEATTTAAADAIIGFAFGYLIAAGVGKLTGIDVPAWVSVASGAAVTAAVQWHRENYG